MGEMGLDASCWFNLTGVFDVIDFPLILDETVFVPGKHRLVGGKRLDLLPVVRGIPVKGDFNLSVVSFLDRTVRPDIVPKFKSFSCRTQLTLLLVCRWPFGAFCFWVTRSFLPQFPRSDRASS